jgi:hypothetical protein
MVMRSIFIFFFALTFITCKKDKAPDTGEYTDVIYEIETSDVGFTFVKTMEYDVANGPNQTTALDWPVLSTGTFKKTVRIKRGFEAEITANHPTSARWTLRIRRANGQLLASATPVFFPAPVNGFFAGFSVTVD